MKILYKGRIKPKTDNWYWRCHRCHTIGYHETDDNYKECSSEGWYAFRCPICCEQIRNDRYFNRLIAWLLYKVKYRKGGGK